MNSYTDLQLQVLYILLLIVRFVNLFSLKLN